MATKTLKRKEVELGFVQIPVKDRAELLGSLTTPFVTKLNDFPAKVDNNGRLWCTQYLRNRFPINSVVLLTKNRVGFELSLNGKEHITPVSEGAGEQSSVQDYDSKTAVLEPEMPVCSNKSWHKVLEGDCIKYLSDGAIGNVNLTFFDPPYLQGKEYRFFDDNQSDEKYWDWIKAIVSGTYKSTSEGGALYFMHREKNAEKVLKIVREAGWNFQNLIIWKKKTSAVPIETRFSKQFQIIVYAIKGAKPRVFNKVRIDPPPLPEHKYRHENGIYITDVWDDIRELTSGYFAGDEALRDKEGKRMHVQQTPVSLLLRIILSSTMPDDIVFDPTAGTGTTLVVAKQLGRNSIGVEIDPAHVELINRRLTKLRSADDISSQRLYYQFTKYLDTIWQSSKIDSTKQEKLV